MGEDILNIVMITGMGVLGCLIAYTTLKEEVARKVKIWNRNQVGASFITLSTKQVWIISICVGALCGGCTYRFLYDMESWINVTKMLVTILCLAGAGCMDLREHRIPNIFPMILSVAGVILLTLGSVLQQQGATSYWVSSMFATVVCGLGFSLIYLLTRQGIGLGDIKLICAMAIVGGVQMICGSLFFAVLLCAVVSVVMVLWKKMNLQGVLPFGPFLFMGYVVTIALSLY